MRIRDVLEADWHIDKISVTVRNNNTEYVMKYCIGRDVKPTKYERFSEETALGDLYVDNGRYVLYIPKIIQFRQLENKPNGKEFCCGVLTSEIPKKILDLDVSHMRPYDCGHSSGMHGYRFTCYVDSWLETFAPNVDSFPELDKVLYSDRKPYIEEELEAIF